MAERRDTELAGEQRVRSGKCATEIHWRVGLGKCYDPRNFQDTLSLLDLEKSSGFSLRGSRSAGVRERAGSGVSQPPVAVYKKTFIDNIGRPCGARMDRSYKREHLELWSCVPPTPSTNINIQSASIELTSRAGTIACYKRDWRLKNGRR